MATNNKNIEVRTTRRLYAMYYIRDPVILWLSGIFMGMGLSLGILMMQSSKYFKNITTRVLVLLLGVGIIMIISYLSIKLIPEPKLKCYIEEPEKYQTMKI